MGKKFFTSIWTLAHITISIVFKTQLILKNTLLVLMDKTLKCLRLSLGHRPGLDVAHINNNYGQARASLSEFDGHYGCVML
jgi:hypothetical protein